MKSQTLMITVLLITLADASLGAEGYPTVHAGSARMVARAEGSKARMEITVQVYNYANAPGREIRKAESTAGWMYQKAGIDVHWVDCPLPVRARGADQVCKQADDPKLFVLSINPESPPDNSATALGFALLQGRSNHAAAVYPRIVAQIAQHPDYQDSCLLGSVMAHELAHLLFRSARHGEGIMQPNWSRRDYLAMAQRKLTFTAGQAQELRSMLAARIEREDRELGPAMVVAAIHP